MIKENINEKYHKENKNTYKRLNDNEEKDMYINPSMKKFRTFIGGICLIIFIFAMFEPTKTTDYRENLTSGVVENVGVGDILSEDALNLKPIDTEIGVESGYGNLEISIWNFASVEDNDYVEVFIDGVSQGGPFSIRHKPIKFSVPDKAIIEVKGIRDGSNNGITYAVYFNKTNETYLNTVPLNLKNTYKIISK